MTFEVNNPATGEFIEKVKTNTEEEIKQAIKNCYEGFKTWSEVNAHDRSNYLSKWSDKIQENKEAIAEVMTKENGKPLRESLGDRKSTRLNSSHVAISYAVFCLKKKKKTITQTQPTK